jgi:hypothetical protein
VWFFSGVVARLIPPDEDEGGEQAQLYFHIVYEDGDEEDLTFNELRKVLVTKGKQPAATVASIPPEVELDDAPLEEEPPLTATPSPLSLDDTLNGYQEIVLTASRNVAMAAAQSETNA